MSRTFRLLLPSLFFLIATACSNESSTGPVEIEWEHDACQRCNMVLNDSYHAAQVRYRSDAGKSKIFVFDDIGCAVVWLEDKAWRDDPATEIWVNDHKTGAWIDARKSHYVGGQQTPMLYGLGAQLEATPGSIPFERAKQHVFEVERRLNIHGGR